MRSERLERFGQTARVVRLTLGLSQRVLARRIDRSQAWVSLMEGGRISRLTVGDADAVCDGLGANLVFGIEAPTVLGAPRQRDAAHARCVSYVVRRLQAAGWDVRREIQIGPRDRPGWIDVLAFDRESRVLLVIEIKTELLDLGALERQLGWYVREARAVARPLGWAPSDAVGLALVLATGANDDRLRENAPGIRQVFPRKWQDLMRLISGDSPIEPGWGLAMIDPRSRARAWCRPTVLDGRRSAAPYRDLADFLRSSR